MEQIALSKLTAKCQATIPANIRGVLGLRPGDSVAFKVMPGEKVLIQKATPLDLEFARAQEGTLASEWFSENDEEAFSDL